jgi:hypothetical protein
MIWVAAPPAGTGPAAITRHESVIGSYAAPSKLAGSPHNGPPPTSAPHSSLVSAIPDHTTSSDPVHTDVGNALGPSGDADRARHDDGAVVEVVLDDADGASVAAVDDSVVDVDTVEATSMSVTGLDTVGARSGGSLPTPSSAPPQPTDTATSAAVDTTAGSILSTARARVPDPGTSSLSPADPHRRTTITVVAQGSHDRRRRGDHSRRYGTGDRTTAPNHEGGTAWPRHIGMSIAAGEGD